MRGTTFTTKLAALLLLPLSLLGCGPAASRLESRTFSSAKLGKAIPFSVLRAPERPGVDPATLPVILFLHGMGSDHLAFDEFGVSDAIYRAMQTGEIPLTHLVFPNGERGFYLNWYDGSHPYEDYILEEVLLNAEAVLGVDASVPTHIAGVSMGGIGAVQIGLRNPERFESISCISGVILNREEANEMMDSLLIRMFAPVKRIWGDGTDNDFSDSINPYKLITRPGPKPRLFLAYGDGETDRIQETTERFFRDAKTARLVVTREVYAGEHNWEDWTPVLKHAIRNAL